MSVGNNSEMRQNGRNKDPMVVIVDEYTKLPSLDDDEERKKEVGDHLVANEEAIKISAKNDGHV